MRNVSNVTWGYYILIMKKFLRISTQVGKNALKASVIFCKYYGKALIKTIVVVYYLNIK